jgi:ubiquinone/menaquinone biosynthesis C-methylase UbiE
MPNRMTNKAQVREHLYADPGKLGSRIDLHARFSTNPQSFADWELGLVNLSGVRAALDAGCGTGNSLLPLARRVATEGGAVVALDLSAGVLATARARVEAEGLPVRCMEGDIEALPFAAASFDLVLANYMLYHVPHLDRAIAELRRVLRPGGVLLAATNGRANMPELRALVARACAESGVPAPVVASLARAQNRSPWAYLGYFGLENGAEPLRRSFADVRLKRYPDELRVTEAEPLVAYVASLSSLDAVTESAAATPEDRAALRARILGRLGALAAERIAAEGCVRITKHTGAFVAR